MDTRKTCSREIELHVQVLSTVLSSIVKHNWGDNIHMSTKNCEESGCDLDLDLLIILCSLHVYLS
jgi:hypothetical protein